MVCALCINFKLTYMRKRRKHRNETSLGSPKGCEEVHFRPAPNWRVFFWCTVVGPWTTQVWTVRVHLYMGCGFFPPINTYYTQPIAGWMQIWNWRHWWPTVKIYPDFWLCRGPAPLTSILFKGRLHPDFVFHFLQFMNEPLLPLLFSLFFPKVDLKYPDHPWYLF